jgi:tartrate-resistant acid phosphatase type 5
MRQFLSRAVSGGAVAALLWGTLVAGLPGQGADIVIGVIGDFGSAALSQDGYANELAVSRLVKSWKPEFIITVGDNNYPTNGAETIDFNIGQFYHEFIHPYHGAYGAGASSNRFFPCIGNHDWGLGLFGSNVLKPYLDYFTLPGNERYYTHRHGNVEIFAVSSDPMEPDGNTATSKQALWLRQALAASTATWRLVYFHNPPYSSGYWHGTYTGESTNMAWPFREWGATAVLSGHDHLYERVFTNGLTYFVVGTGGDRLDRFRPPPVAGSIMGYNSTHGALRIDATETNLHFRFYNVRQQLIDGCRIEAPPDRPRPGR